MSESVVSEECYLLVCRHRDDLREENRRLREVMARIKRQSDVFSTGVCRDISAMAEEALTQPATPTRDGGEG